MIEMELKDIKFDTIYDVGMCFKKKKNIRNLMYKIVEEAMVKKEEGNDVIILNSRKKSFYNIEYKFVFDVLKLWLKENEVSDLELDKFHNFF